MRGGARVLPGGPTTRRGWASAAYRLAPLIAMGSALASPQFAAHACAPCHAKQVEGYFKSGMGRSLSRAFDQPGGSFRHTASGTRFEIAVGGGTMRQRIERRGMEAEYPIDYTIGSGNAGYGFLVKAGDRLFQSPVSYYTKSRKWEIAPGYEAASHPDFNRPVTAECVWCHAGRPLHIAESVNRYREPVFEFEAISCDRCHGPVENHLKRPLAATIVNPRKLPQTLRQGVCEQCHLGGEARVLNLGRSWGDFQPGMPTEEVFSVYVYSRPPEAPGREDFKVVSHVEQLAQSLCARRSEGRMWCGTCHNPHVNPTDPASHYRERCLSRHSEALPASHPQPAGDCVSCHMARRQGRDSGHSAFTDHRIARRIVTRAESTPPRDLRAWRELSGVLAARNLGLAYIRVGNRDSSEYHFNRGYALLAENAASLANDPEVLVAMGEVLMLKAKPKEALLLFERAVRLRPGDALLYPNVAVAWKALGSHGKAIAAAERAIDLDPYLDSAYSILAAIYQEAGQPQLARQTWQRYLARMPQILFARVAARQ